MQDYLAQLIIPYLNNFDSEVEIKLHSPKSYSSTFEILYKDNSVLTFDIYRHIFYDARRYEESYFTRIINNIELNLKTKYRELEEWINYKNKPIKMVKNLKDFIWFITHKKKTKEFLDAIIKRERQEIESIQKNIERLKQRHKEFLETQHILEQKYLYWKNLFTRWGYKEDNNDIIKLR